MLVKDVANKNMKLMEMEYMDFKNKLQVWSLNSWDTFSGGSQIWEAKWEVLGSHENGAALC